jgi:hypothetical protein
MTGQITRESAFGKALYELGQNPNYKTYLEVGTWNGLGSTLCLVEGVRTKQNAGDNHIYSLETSLGMFEKACRAWQSAAVPFLHLLYGRLHGSIMTEDEIRSHPAFKNPTLQEHFSLYYTSDCEQIQSTPLLTAFPTYIDVVVLDGGEFSSYGDWEALKSRLPRIVALDDTFVIKNSRVLAELESSGWRTIAEGGDRNGWAILEAAAVQAGNT